MNQEQIRKNWEYRGYTFGFFKDHPGQVWLKETREHRIKTIGLEEIPEEAMRLDFFE